MRLNKSFCRMEPTGSLQVQVLADAGDAAPVYMNDDVTGFELKTTVEVSLEKGQMAYANLGMAFCPPQGSEILLRKRYARQDLEARRIESSERHYW